MKTQTHHHRYRVFLSWMTNGTFCCVHFISNFGEKETNMDVMFCPVNMFGCEIKHEEAKKKAMCLCSNGCISRKEWRQKLWAWTDQHGQMACDNGWENSALTCWFWSELVPVGSAHSQEPVTQVQVEALLRCYSADNLKTTRGLGQDSARYLEDHPWKTEPVSHKEANMKVKVEQEVKFQKDSITNLTEKHQNLKPCNRYRNK